MIAAHPDPPQIVDLGGPVMATPSFTSITFPGDPLVADLDKFVATIGATQYWKTVTSEYGVGPGSASPPVHWSNAADAPTDFPSLKAFLASALDGTHPDVPTPTNNQVYIIFLPPGVQYMTATGIACQGTYAFHAATTDTMGRKVIYALVPRCDPSAYMGITTALDGTTSTLAHEMVEAVTDPFPGGAMEAYGRVDDVHGAWEIGSQGETGDLCGDAVAYAARRITPSDFPYLVQRTWSNASIKAGHSPCLPIPSGETFVAAVPVVSDDVSVPIGNGNVTLNAKGVYLPVGSTKTVDLALYSDGPLSQPFNVRVMQPAANYLQLALDQSTGQNGDHLKLTITTMSSSPTGLVKLAVQASTQDFSNHAFQTMFAVVATQ
jgi:hypothetical protein